jgi:succinyl-diaminopimelate desuccinylase
LADRVAAALGGQPHLEVRRIGANVVARTHLGRGTRVILAGHLDTVPANGNAAARLQGDTLWGLGSADMKGGLAVMLALAQALSAPALDVTYVFYTGEEVAREHNGLLAIAAAAPHLLEGDAAILGEPTGALVEAGCQGTMRVQITLGGVRAHTARPFTGRNAIHRLAPLLQRVADWPGREVVLDGCTYAEQLQAVAVEGGVAANVVPDQVRVTLNHRYAPDRGGKEAGAFLLDLLQGTWDPESGDIWEVLDTGDGAPPSLGHPLLHALVEKSGAAPKAKVGWTDVASFWEHGVPAANFGPGDPLLAHHPDERVTAAQLEQAHQVLHALIT